MSAIRKTTAATKPPTAARLVVWSSRAPGLHLNCPQ